MLQHLFLLCCMALICSSCHHAITLHVDAQANARTSKGSARHPFTDFATAYNKTCQLREQAPSRPVHIIFHAGTYAFDRGYLLDEKFSNTKIMAVPGEEVIFSGGLSLPVSHLRTTCEKEIPLHHILLSDCGISDYGEIKNIGFARPYHYNRGELFVNGLPMQLSRWPNNNTLAMGKIYDTGSIPRKDDYSNRGAVMGYDTAYISRWYGDQEVWISGYFKYGYAEDALRIAAIDTVARTITTDGPTLYGFGSGSSWNRWYAFNIKEETDVPGEYYLDRKKGEITFIPPTRPVEELHFTLLNEPFFDIWKTCNLTIEGIVFEYSRAVMLSLCDTRNVTIRGCTFRNGGSLGIQVGMGILPFSEFRHTGIGQPARAVMGNLQQHLYDQPTFNRLGGYDNLITHCDFYQLGAGGISIGGGNRKTLEPGNNTVSHCLFHDNNRLERSYRPAVDLTGVGNRLLHCEIYNCPSMAILLHGNDHLIASNYIHHACQEIEDQGALYYGRDPSECGNIVRYNLFAHLPDTYSTCAIYHDDGACGMTAYANIFYKAGKQAVLLGGGSDNIYQENLFLNGAIGIHIDNRLQNWGKAMAQQGGIFEQRLRSIRHDQPPYAVRYPYIRTYLPNDGTPKRNKVEDNTFVGIRKVADHPNWLEMDGNRIVPHPCADKIIKNAHELLDILPKDSLHWHREWETIGRQCLHP